MCLTPLPLGIKKNITSYIESRGSRFFFYVRRMQERLRILNLCSTNKSLDHSLPVNWC